jgi:hypothetical protein
MVDPPSTDDREVHATASRVRKRRRATGPQYRRVCAHAPRQCRVESARAPTGSRRLRSCRSGERHDRLAVRAAP